MLHDDCCFCDDCIYNKIPVHVEVLRAVDQDKLQLMKFERITDYFEDKDIW